MSDPLPLHAPPAPSSSQLGVRPELPLSVALACRNNAATIGRLLESLGHLGGAVEVVALDNGSTDGTIEALEGAGARVIRGQWRGYARTKQEVMEACTRPWVLNLDSDESLEPGLGRAIGDVVRDGGGEGGMGGVGGARVNRQTWYRGRPLRHAWQPEWILRLVRRNAAAWTGAEPHARLEMLPPEPGSASRGEATRVVTIGGGPGGNLRHDSFDTFAAHLARQAQYSRQGAEALHAAGKRGSYLRLLTSPPGAFLKQLVLKQGFRDGYPGWLAAASTAAGALMKHAVLIELSRGAGDGAASGTGGSPTAHQ